MSTTYKNKKRASIATILAASFGTLICIGILAVLGVSLYSGLANTRELLISNATNEMASVQRNLTSVLDPMENLARDVANLIYEGAISIEDDKSMENGLLTAMAGSKHLLGLGFIYPDLSVMMSERISGEIKRTRHRGDMVSLELLEEMKKGAAGSWGQLVYVPEAGQTVMNYRQPILKDGKFLGVVIAAIPVTEVSKAVQKDGIVKDEGRFILYGKNHVLSQQGFKVNSDRLTLEGVTPELSSVEDPVLSSIWTAPRTPFRFFNAGQNFDGHFTDVNGHRYQFIYTSLEGYTDKPLIIGYQLPFEDSGKQIIRLAAAGMTGLVILIISVIIAFFIGKKIARPIEVLSNASRRISSLDFKSVDDLPRSRMKELDDAAQAYNTMLRGLNWFENYVPKSLVKKLMKSGDAHSETRSVTVMFTDIVGFTPIAENMPSEDVAKLLNDHFEILAKCIEAEGGTIDKFIGDAIMAFWGAPDYQTDHAARACRAARAIEIAIKEDNQKRIKNGQSPIHLRIGVHTGRLVVGNIGSSGRLNYTVVGDTVNVAQRIEQLGKTVAPDQIDEVLTLVSSDVYEVAHEEIKFVDVGQHAVKGRDNKVEIYKIAYDG